MPARRRRGGLGDLAKTLWGGAALVLLPHRESFRIGELATLCAVPADELRAWEADFPELSPKRNPSGQRSYSRAQAERVLRIKQLMQEEKSDRAAVRRRLDEPIPLPRPFIPAMLPAEHVPHPHPLALSSLPAPASQLSSEAVAFLREGLTALISLCNQPDPADAPQQGNAQQQPGK